jgi:hypothetical protein
MVYQVGASSDGVLERAISYGNFDLGPGSLELFCAARHAARAGQLCLWTDPQTGACQVLQAS